MNSEGCITNENTVDQEGFAMFPEDHVEVVETAVEDKPVETAVDTAVEDKPVDAETLAASVADDHSHE